MVLKTKHAVFIFEFKFNKTAEEVLQQILSKNYHKQYSLDGYELILVGVYFDTASRSLNQWKMHSSKT